MKNKKNYTLQIKEENINRMKYIKDLSNKKINPNILINNYIEKMLENLEKKFNIDKNSHKESKICNKCYSYMKIIDYKEKKYWACTAYPKCKNMLEIKED